MRALHLDDDIGAVSLLVEIPAGGMLAERKLAATSETLILDGGALHPVLGPLTATDYLREEAPGSTSSLTTEVDSTLLIFDHFDTRVTDAAGRELTLRDLVASNGDSQRGGNRYGS